MKNTEFDSGVDNINQAKTNKGGLNHKMNKNLLLCGLFLIGIFLMSGSVNAGITFNETAMIPSANAWTHNTTPRFWIANITGNSTGVANISCTLYINDVAYNTTHGHANNTPLTIGANATFSPGNYTWFVNCTDNQSSANGTLTTARMFSIYSTVLKDSWYVKDSSDNIYPANHSAIVNQTTNFYIDLNSTHFKTAIGWNATAVVWNTSSWTTVDLNASSGISNSVAKFQILNTDFKAAKSAVGTSANQTRMRIYLSNGTAKQVQMLEVGVWSHMYSVVVDTTSMTVGTATTLSYNITNLSSTIGNDPAFTHHINLTDVTMVNGSPRASDIYDLKVYGVGAHASNRVTLTPEYVGNLSLFIVDATTGSWATVLDAGICTVNKTIVVGAGGISPASTVVTTSSPTNLYKHFEFNITLNLTLLNETIQDFGNYSASWRNNISYNITMSAGVSNATKNDSNINISGVTNSLDVMFNWSDLSKFNNTGSTSGDVSVDVTILLDINHDGMWDYNTTITGEKTVTDAADLVILSVTPTSKNISAGVKTTISIAARNKSNHCPLNNNMTLTATDTKFYNGSRYTNALDSITNVSNCTATFDITPEQYGTITATVSWGALTTASDTFTVHGARVDRDAITPELGTRLVFNQSQTVTIPVQRMDGTPDYGAFINVSSSAGYYLNTTVGQNISGLSGNYVVYSFTIKPNVTGYLNITIAGGGKRNATFLNAFDVKYQDLYTIEPTHKGAAVSTLTAGLNNTLNVTVRYTANTTLTGGELTITYYNSSQTVGGATYLRQEKHFGNVTNATTIGTAASKYAVKALLEVTNASASKYGDLELDVAAPTLSLSSTLIFLNSTKTIGNGCTCFTPINDTTANLTFSVSTPSANATIFVYIENRTGILLANSTATGNTVILNEQNMSWLMLGNVTSYLNNFSRLYVVLNNSEHVGGWNLLNITLCEPTIGLSKSAVPVGLNTSVEITVTACGEAVSGVKVNVTNQSGTVTLANGTTDSSGKVTLLLGPAASGNLRIWVNEMCVTDYIIATKTLSVTYTPATVYENTPIVITVRPYGSTTEVVENAIITIQAPGASESVTYGPLAGGTKTIESPVYVADSPYVVQAVGVQGETWTASATVYISVNSGTGPTTTTTTTTITTSTTIAPVDHLVINEFLSHQGVECVTEQIELYNPTDAEVDLTGWTIKDNSALPASLDGKTIAAGGYLLLDEAEDFTFALNNNGDTIILKNGDTIIDQVAYGDYDDGDVSDNAVAPDECKSAGRDPNGVDTDVDNVDFTEFDTPTLGSANTVTAAVPGDTNGDGDVDDTELLVYIDQWAAGTVTDSDLLSAIEYWAT